MIQEERETLEEGYDFKKTLITALLPIFLGTNTKISSSDLISSKSKIIQSQFSDALKNYLKPLEFKEQDQFIKDLLKGEKKSFDYNNNTYIIQIEDKDIKDIDKKIRATTISGRDVFDVSPENLSKILPIKVETKTSHNYN